MDKEFKDLNNDELYKLIGNNVAKFRKRANMSQLELSLEMGNKSTSLVASAEIYKKYQKF
jgi:ribosome-binding protein aMBF1 (putative translation factor)